MTEKEIRRQLKEFKNGSRLVEIKLKELSKLKREKYDFISPKTSKITDMPRAVGTADTVFSSYLDINDNYDKLLKKLEKDISRIVADLEEIKEAVNKLPSIYRVVIEKHYIEGKRWDIVARELSYSERQIFYIHKSAIETMLLFINNTINVA